MNVLLVCGAGITTNMLSAKLQKYAQENGRPDYFTAGRIGAYAELLPHADLVLIAPQAQPLSAPLRSQAEGQGIPCVQLDEETFAMGQLDKIYVQIDGARARPASRPESVKLTFPLIGQAAINAALACVPILLFGLLCRGLWLLFPASALLDASRATLSLLVLYFMFSLGYQCGKLTHREPVSRGLIAVGSPLLMLPISGQAETWQLPFRVPTGQLPLELFAFPFAGLLVCLSLVAILLNDRLDKLRLPPSLALIPMMENTFKMGIIFLLFILLRVSLSFL